MHSASINLLWAAWATALRQSPWSLALTAMLALGLSEPITAAEAAPASTVRGRVLDLAGKPATNVWVQVQTLDPSAPDFARTGGWALASTNSGQTLVSFCLQVRWW